MPRAALAHAFGARYELPVPVWLFIVGGALTVTVTFVIVAVFARAGAERYAEARVLLPASLLLHPATRIAVKALGVAALVLVLVAGFAGTKDPNKNISPTLVWIVWWVGFSYFAMLVGNPWPVLNPWRTLYGQRKGVRPYFSGAWPALALLLLFGWIELVFPFRATPLVLASLVVAYSALTFFGVARYGTDAWLRNADPFHRLFELLSRFAPFAIEDGKLVLRPPAAGLMGRDNVATGVAEVGFVIAMLAIVLFDGLQGSKHWVVLEDAIHALDPKLGDAGWVALHSIGFVATWLAFLALYFAACAAASAAGGRVSTLRCALVFAPTLIPIAVGYHFAHTFTYLLVQGQSLAFLVSDPLGLGWNLFGTRDATTDTALISTKTAWYLALGAIVTGHAISVYLAHVAAERMLEQRDRALRALVPMTVLMVLYTILSLQILAEPLVRYSGPQETII